jgi:hypothetical protein
VAAAPAGLTGPGPRPRGARRSELVAIVITVFGAIVFGGGLATEIHDAQTRAAEILITYSPPLSMASQPAQARQVGDTLRTASLWYSLHNPMPGSPWVWNVQSTSQGVRVQGPVALFNVIGLDNVYRWSPPPTIVPLALGAGIALGGLVTGAMLWQRRQPEAPRSRTAPQSRTMSAKRE